MGGTVSGFDTAFIINRLSSANVVNEDPTAEHDVGGKPEEDQRARKKECIDYMGYTNGEIMRRIFLLV